MLITEMTTNMSLDKRYELFELLCYNLYKQDWASTHVSKEKRQQSIMEYYDYVIECLQDGFVPESYELYLFHNGYHGENYVFFDEFLECEFVDEEYMAYLLKDFPELQEFYKQYRNDCELELALKELDELDLENESEVSL